MTFLERVLAEAEDLVPDPAVRAQLLERLVAAAPMDLIAIAIDGAAVAALKVAVARGYMRASVEGFALARIAENITRAAGGMLIGELFGGDARRAWRRP